jgi:hypothetical protein
MMGGTADGRYYPSLAAHSIYRFATPSLRPPTGIFSPLARNGLSGARHDLPSAGPNYS